MSKEAARKFNDNLRTAARKLEAGELPEVRIPFFGIDQLPGGLERYTSSYIRITMGRCVDNGRIRIIRDAEHMDELERPTPGYLITYIPADEDTNSTRRKRKENQERQAGARDLVRYLDKVMPDISDMEQGAQLGAIEGIKRFKKLINEKAGE